MTTYLVTGGTGFLGRNLLQRLVARPDADVHVLVREQSQGRLERLIHELDGGERISPLVGDLTKSRLGVSASRRRQLTGKVDHIVHLAAVYDMTADEASNQRANVDGTREAVALANDLGVGCLHHVSSVAVAGDYDGEFTEDMFDVGQVLPSAYHATKFEAERIVRDESQVPWRVYRPAIVVGDSRTGDIDKIDGPYYFFPSIARLTGLPAWLPLLAPDIGDTNVVPVDFVADAMDVLIHRNGLDGQAFHLVDPEPLRVIDLVNALCRTAGAPQALATIDRRLSGPALQAAGLLGRLPAATTVAELALAQLGVPPAVIPHMTFRPVFRADATQEALAGSGVSVPAFASYADRLWDYWARNLDPDRARRSRPGGALAGRTVVITGASSGIGAATAMAVAARGGIPILVARRTEKLEELRRDIERDGGHAFVYSCDITQPESVEAVVKQMLADHDGIDMLVNNAGRSIRRSVKLSVDRFHDFERTMALNYFGAVRLILALLPHMSERRFGHVVNVSSIGVQAGPPRFSAYVASKAALDAFSKVVASETFGDGITFTTIHMPLVRTPMIKPTKIYEAFPTISPEQAASMVVDALVDKPKHIGTGLGTFAEVSYAVAPKAVDAVLHLAYRLFPDSTAAGGSDRLPKTGPEATLSRAALAMARVLRGVHW